MGGGTAYMGSGTFRPFSGAPRAGSISASDGTPDINSSESTDREE